jgi:hypothetical protein
VALDIGGKNKKLGNEDLSFYNLGGGVFENGETNLYSLETGGS